MLHIIVNADDFGISHDVNTAICECFRKRIISSTTLMVNMPFADEAVEMAKSNGFDERVGLHLNLTSGMPMTQNIRRFKLFCKKDGRFNAAFEQNTCTRLRLGKKVSAAMYGEIDTQLHRYLEYGLPERHLDSHHHVHTDRAVYRVLMPLLHRYDIKSVRLSRNIYNHISMPKKLYKNRYNHTLRSRRLAKTDYFGSFRDFRENIDKIPDNSVVEIMLHPMYSSDGVLYDTHTPMSEVTDFIASIKAVYEFY